jgi:hypothetical protein
LHALPAKDCPFTRDLEQMFATAQDIVARGAVNPDFLPIAADDAFAGRYRITLDTGRQQFYLHLDPLAWGVVQ